MIGICTKISTNEQNARHVIEKKKKTQCSEFKRGRIHI